MTFQVKLALIGIVGIVLIVIICCAGCGEVTLGLDRDGGFAGGAAGEEMIKLDSGAVDTAGTAGATVTFGRPLGAGCSTDTQCASTICDGATHACCDGHVDTCSTCIGGYKTPVPDGAVICGVCAGGVLQPSSDGTACGTSACGGTELPTGEGSPTPPTGISCEGSGDRTYYQGCYYPTATNSTCHSGACVAAKTDCTTIACPASCTKLYSECNLRATGVAICRCVDTAHQPCN